MRSLAFASLLVVLALLAVACGGDDGGGGASRAVSGGTAGDSGVAFALTGGEIDGQATGVTVVGVGEVTAEPDGVLMRLTIGSDDVGFDGSLPRLELLDDQELEPVVAALREAGVDEDSITVDTFVADPYDTFGTGVAEITFRWDKPKELKTVLESAQDAVRKETEYGIQAAVTVFTVEDCASLEDQAREAALKDAREGAERVAEQADVTLGAITAITQGDPYAILYGIGAGCDVLEEFASVYEFVALSGNTSSAVTISVALRVTYAIE